MIPSHSATEEFHKGHSLLLGIHHRGWQKFPLNFAGRYVCPHLEEEDLFVLNNNKEAVKYFLLEKEAVKYWRQNYNIGGKS